SSTPYLYPLSLHDALPISLITTDVFLNFSKEFRMFLYCSPPSFKFILFNNLYSVKVIQSENPCSSHKENNANNVLASAIVNIIRSEEHTSELQSRFDLVCR